MDSKIISKLFLIITFLTTTQLNAVEFKGKFIQGHYIVGVTDPSSKIIIDKKNVKVSEDGYFKIDKAKKLLGYKPQYDLIKALKEINADTIH